jgi:diguanylate cyclase (GGDEF)-like protein
MFKIEKQNTLLEESKRKYKEQYRRLEEKEAKLEQIAFYDMVTELPNRRMFVETLGRSLADAKSKAHKAGVFFVDLDMFKAVNDTLGHESGDRLLSLVAERLIKCLGKEDLLARFGGDKFLINVNGASEKEEIEKVGGMVIRAMSEPFVIRGTELFVSASVGISLYPTTERTLKRLSEARIWRCTRQKARERTGMPFARTK